MQLTPVALSSSEWRGQVLLLTISIIYYASFLQGTTMIYNSTERFSNNALVKFDMLMICIQLSFVYFILCYIVWKKETFEI